MFPIFYLKIKRLIDFFLSLSVLLFFSPFFILLSAAIKLESRGPVLFKQKRIGLNGRVFNLFKFRSMRVGAEKEGVYETKGDKRVTRLGRLIRKYSIDELPQLINIIKGEMSIIGPRPVLTYHPWPYEEYTDEQKKRFSVRPGVTGWAQVNGRKDVEWNKRIKYDVEYVENVSFVFDLKIFLKTVVSVLTGKDNVNIGETAVKRPSSG
jgi:undecaprenyl phosphate N,N'-diacetylbacillosamine 1-phosphate transferase